MIKVINITKSYGAVTLLESISFNVNKKERIGLVGRNGHGKSTLLKMILKQEYQDSGDIVIPKDYSIGYVNQHVNFTQSSILEEGALGLTETERDELWKVEKILSGLGFKEKDFNQNPDVFSGGYQVRLNLAKVLLSEPDLLLLDEPTNYLDIISIRWLSQFLRQWPGELMLVTHDRSFMDSVITHVVGIHRKQIRKIEGVTDNYYNQIIKEEEIYEKTRINDEKKKKEVELFITRFRAKARLAGLVQSRVKALEKKGTLDKLDKIKSLEFSFAYKDFNAKQLMNASHLSFNYPKGPSLIDDFSVSINKEDRICIIGKNGKGKTTLLKLLCNELVPLSGEKHVHPNCEIGYYAQTNTINLEDSLTVEDEIVQSGCDRQLARNICGAMMFEGDAALKKISVLSGGEKARVLLGKILAAPCNILFLDEPTNHLDMEACDSLLAAIDDFPGAVIMVTHNEMFLHALATRFIIFQNDRVSLFEGRYQDFLERVGWDEERESTDKSDEVKEMSGKNKKELRKLKAQIMARKSKELKPLENKISELEETIESFEKEHGDINQTMIEASQRGDGTRISQLSKEVHNLQNKIDTLYDELERYTLEYEAKNEEFENLLSDLQ